MSRTLSPGSCRNRVRRIRIGWHLFFLFRICGRFGLWLHETEVEGITLSRRVKQQLPNVRAR